MQNFRARRGQIGKTNVKRNFSIFYLLKFDLFLFERTPYSMNSLFNEFFRDFWHRFLGQIFDQVFDQIFDQIFGQGFDQGFGDRKYSVQYYWDRKYSVQFYLDRGKYYLLSTTRNPKNPKLYFRYYRVLFENS